MFIGGQSYDTAFDRRDKIYEFDIEKETWSLVGRMHLKRAAHAVSLVKTEDIVDYCEEIKTTTTKTTSTSTTGSSTTTTTSGSSDTKDLKSKILFLLFLMLVNLF